MAEFEEAYPFVRAADWAHHDWIPRENIAELWFAYLRISPSYGLVRECQGDLSRALKSTKIPQDIEMVQAVYDDFGDVWDAPFTDWWASRGQPLFSDTSPPQHAAKLALLEPGKNFSSDTLMGLQSYMEGSWQDAGQPASLVLAIPACMSPEEIARDIRAILRETPPAAKRRPRSRAAYAPISDKRMNQSALLKYLKLYWYSVAMDDRPLWRLGLEQGVSAKYDAKKFANADIESPEYADDRRTLSILTSRALFRARMIAENAARGVFPSYEPCSSALEFGDAGLNNALLLKAFELAGRR